LAALALLPLTASPSLAQSTGSAVRLTNADLLRWPARDQRLWVHGAIEGLANALLLTNREHGRCVLSWYGDRSTRFAAFQESARANPDRQPLTVLIALANRQCHFYQP